MLKLWQNIHFAGMRGAAIAADKDIEIIIQFKI